MRLFAYSRNTLGESVVWSQSQRSLHWLDLIECRLFCATLEGTVRSYPIDLPAPLGAILVTHTPATMLLFAGRAVYSLEVASGSVQPLATELLPTNAHYNDAKTDAAGVVWAVSADDDEEMPVGELHEFLALRPSSRGHAYVVGNGPAFGRAGDPVFVSDSTNGTVLRLRRSPLGGLEPPEIFASFDGALPDGLAVDAEGCVWVALWGGAAVARLSPDGVVVERRDVPARNVTSVAFGGDDLCTLFVTTARTETDQEDLQRFPNAGGVFCTTTEVPGLSIPAARFPGSG